MESVFAVYGIVGDIKLRAVMRAFRHACALAVDIEQESGAYAFKAKINTLARGFFESERAAIKPDGVFQRDMRHIHLHGVVYVCILNLTVAVILPAGGNGQLFAEISRRDILGKLKRRFVIAEIPFAAREQAIAFVAHARERSAFTCAGNICGARRGSSHTLIFRIKKLFCKHFIYLTCFEQSVFQPMKPFRFRRGCIFPLR